MRRTLVLLLFLITAAAIALVIVQPGPAGELLGSTSAIVLGVIALTFVVLFLWNLIALPMALPQQLLFTPTPEDNVPGNLRELSYALEERGFERVYGPAIMNTRPGTLMLGYIQKDEPIYAFAGHVGLLGAQTTVLTFVSQLQDRRGHLETVGDERLDTVPGPPDLIRQICHGASLDTMLAAHRDGMAYLRECGVPLRALTPESCLPDVSRACSDGRAHLQLHHFRNAWLVLWRSITGLYPANRPLRKRDPRRIRNGATLPLLGRARGPAPTMDTQGPLAG